MFVSTAIRVITMVAFGVPGYLLVRFRALGEEHIKAFAKFLLYACQPALTLSRCTALFSASRFMFPQSASAPLPGLSAMSDLSAYRC